MSLQISKGDLPKNAQKLTKKEAIEYQVELLQKWPNRSDTWPFWLGIPALSAMASFTALVINKRYRVKLKLRDYGMHCTQLIACVTPAVIASIPHYLLVSQPTLIHSETCSVCLQIRAVGLQLFASTIYPSMTLPIANFMFAIRHGTYRLPYWADYKGTIKLWLSMNKTVFPRLKIILPLQIFAMLFLTYMEGSSLRNIESKIASGEVQMPRLKIRNEH